MSIWGAVVSAGSSLLGGLVSDRRNRIEGDENREQALSMHRDNIRLQKEFAQQGIRWRVQDAQAAGVHPLYALGAQGASYSPSSVSFAGSPPDTLGPALADAGQHIGRAISARQTREERELAEVVQLQQLRRGALENELLAAQIAVTRSQVPPATPSIGPELPSAMPGQGDVRVGRPYRVNPVDIPATQPGRPTQEAGAIPGVRWERTQTGWAPHPSEALGIDDFDVTNMQALEWMLKNRIAPSLGFRHNPPPDKWLPKGATGWIWNAFSQEYQPVFGKRFMGPNYIPRR